ncbi:ankrd52 [Symbiodinium sp. CCMP2456]|nr:ankrd52 [Symbiodinium sp. CCMP2456]
MHTCSSLVQPSCIRAMEPSRFLTLLLVCQIHGLHSYRTENRGAATTSATGNDSALCTFQAQQTHANISNVSAVFFENPDFTLFESRTFYLSRQADCNHPVDDVQLETVPMLTAAKRLQYERRFKVKMIRDGLNAAKRQDAAYANRIWKQLRSSKFETVPLVELHMFPKDAMDVESPWLVFIVPKVEKLFGDTFFLCRPNASHQMAEPQPLQCVANLTFAPLPTRLMNLAKKWDPVLDPLNSTPHRMVLGLELSLLAAVALIGWKVAIPLVNIARLLQKHEDDSDDHLLVDTLLEEVLPKDYKLVHHAEVRNHIDDTAGMMALEAGQQVAVTEMKESRGNLTRSLSDFIIAHAVRVFRPLPRTVWGRLEEPKGWMLLCDSTGRSNIQISDRAPYAANPQLLIPIPVLARRQLLLAASHASVQWSLLDELAGSVPVKIFVIIAFSFFAMHVLVLLQAEWTVEWGVQCDQALQEEDRRRLRTANSHSKRVFLFFAAAMAVSILFGLISTCSRFAWIPCLKLMLAVLIHAWDLHASLTGLGKWREPQLSSEFTEYSAEQLHVSDNRPKILAKKREGHYLLASFFTWFAATVGLSVLVLMSLDCTHMQGTLVHYSFSRGHLMYPAMATSFHNTLLLEDATDSLTFFFEGGSHTQSVSLKIEHPQLESNLSSNVVLFSKEDGVEGVAQVSEMAELSQAAGQYQFSLPPGPLYSRITVAAGSKLKIPAMEYTFHVVRVGGSMSLLVAGEVTTAGGVALFNETRHWFYQQRHPDWYVPDLTGNMTLQARLQPVCYAPLAKLKPTAQTVSSVGPTHVRVNFQFADRCHCGEEDLGTSVHCVAEQPFMLSSSQSVCLFLHESRSFEGSQDEIHVHDSRGSVSRRSFVKWLQDVTFSGKSARLRTVAAQSTVEVKQPKASKEWVLEAQNTTKSQISSTFRISMPDSFFLMRGFQLLLCATQDETDAEELVLPIRIVPHAPPIFLKAASGFLLPDASVNSQRAEYVACNMSDLDPVVGKGLDKRFRAEEEVVYLKRDCTKHDVWQKRFRVVRKDKCEYCDRYSPWNENYDVAVTLSPEFCFNEAIEMDNSTTWRDVQAWIPDIRDSQKACGFAERAVRLEHLHIMPKLLDVFDANCADCDQTPLGVAAAEDKTDAMSLILAADNVEVNAADEHHRTPLTRASWFCSIHAVDLLLRNGADVNRAMPEHENHEDGCQITPLLNIFQKRKALGKYHRYPCYVGAKAAEGSDTSRLNTLLTRLVRANASLMVPETDDCEQRTALVEAIGNGMYSAVPELLRLRADPDQKGLMGDQSERTPLWALLRGLLHHNDELSLGRFLDLTDLVMNVSNNTVNEKGERGRTALMEAAAYCQPSVVKLLLKHGGNPQLEDKKRRNATELARTGKRKDCKDESKKRETLRLLEMEN